jgi:ribosomal protein S6
MPCYQLVLLARPDITPERLATLFRLVARVVYREHGQFRTIENFGVRPLAFPIRKGGQKFEEVRWVHANFDVSPAALPSIGSAIASEKGVLQFKHMREQGYLGEFRPAGVKEKIKPFSAAMRFNADIFDPESLVVQAPGSAGALSAVQRATTRAREAASGIAYQQGTRSQLK